MVTISARNTIMRKFANFVRLYFPHVTTFSTKFWNFTTFKRFFPEFRYYCLDQKLVYNANCPFAMQFVFHKIWLARQRFVLRNICSLVHRFRGKAGAKSVWRRYEKGLFAQRTCGESTVLADEVGKCYWILLTNMKVSRDFCNVLSTIIVHPSNYFGKILSLLYVSCWILYVFIKTSWLISVYFYACSCIMVKKLRLSCFVVQLW